MGGAAAVYEVGGAAAVYEVGGAAAVYEVGGAPLGPSFSPRTDLWSISS